MEKLFRNSIVCSTLLLAVFFLQYSSNSLFPFGLQTGTQAKIFYVVSGSGEIQTLTKNRGKIIVVFYEFRNTIDKNLLLKNSLRKYYKEHQLEADNSLIRIPVVDASSSFWPISLIWKRELRRHSKIAKMTIYADWSGTMFKTYKIKKYVSNFFIIDKEGFVRYYGYGEIPESEIVKIKALLNEIYFE